jgi:hypothetical protein
MKINHRGLEYGVAILFAILISVIFSHLYGTALGEIWHKAMPHLDAAQKAAEGK